jgi:acetyl-CoA C-acetyltransferase
MVAARRTGLSPKGGALAHAPFHLLAARVVRAVMTDANLAVERVDGLFLGNALAAGGNPARVAALAAGLPQHLPAWSVDTQCCSGLDAISLAVDRIRAGSAHVLLAGGTESASQAPLRSMRIDGGAELSYEIARDLGTARTLSDSVAPGSVSWVPYEEADFTPWPQREPSMVQAARELSEQLADPGAEHAWAVRSHARALAAGHPERIAGDVPVEVAGGQDTFTRALTLQACQRAARHPIHNPTTMAPLADGAAMVLLMSEPTARKRLHSQLISEVLSCCQVGADPLLPGLATSALKDWLDQLRADHGEPACVELMESFAAQTILNIKALALESDRVNVDGGLLAMGHPIGASGAVLAARLHHRLRPGEWGVALIPAAGGIASGIALRGVDGR